jgi:hypothetical protein
MGVWGTCWDHFQWSFMIISTIWGPPKAGVPRICSGRKCRRPRDVSCYCGTRRHMGNMGVWVTCWDTTKWSCMTFPTIRGLPNALGPRDWSGRKCRRPRDVSSYCGTRRHMGAMGVWGTCWNIIKWSCITSLTIRGPPKAFVPRDCSRKEMQTSQRRLKLLWHKETH